MKIRRTVSFRMVAAAATVALAGLTLSACGANGSAAAAPPMPTMSMMPMATPSANKTAAPHADPLAVTIRDFGFSPATLTVKIGQTVTWTNQDEEPHTVIGDGIHSGVLGNAGSSYTYTFTKAGTYNYVCSIHPFMHGSVTVTV